MSKTITVVAALCVLACIVTLPFRAHLQDSPVAEHSSEDQQAERFVRLALALGQLRPQELDAYIGPEKLRAHSHAVAYAEGRDLGELLQAAQALLVEIERSPSSLRQEQLLKQVRGLQGLLQVLNAPGRYSFDEEARLIYGISPRYAATSSALEELDALLAGPGALAARVNAFRRQFIVPMEKRKAVFARALEECRARTLRHWRLPANEKLTVEWTREVPAAWHRYQGNGRSILRLNEEAVAFIGSAIDVACHEGYPGHHAQFVMLESPPLEQTVVLLRSPISMLREGAANYGVELAFPAAERLQFERDVLFPLAGLDSKQAQKYQRVHQLVGAFSGATAPVLRDYRDGKLTPREAAERLNATALVSSPEALLQFTDELGSYVLGYTVMQDHVRDFVAAQAGDPWTVLRQLLSSPFNAQGERAAEVGRHPLAQGPRALRIQGFATGL